MTGTLKLLRGYFKRIVIIGSGCGTNAMSILESQSRNVLGDLRVVAIFSDVEKAGILDLGQYGIPTMFVDPGSSRTKLEGSGESRFVEAVSCAEPDLIVLTDFKRVLKPKFLEAFPNKIINVHPSLLPSFPGSNAIERAYKHGVKYTGCTAYRVNEMLDGGKIIDQRVVHITPNDTVEVLTNKIRNEERKLYPSVIRNLFYT